MRAAQPGRLWLGGICLLALAGTPAAVAQDGSAPLATLADAGVGTVTIETAGAPVTERLFTLAVPSSAPRAPKPWYTLRLRASIKVVRPGRALVSAALNGRTAAQVKLIARRRAGQLVIDWDTLDIIQGVRRGQTSSGRVGVAFENFAQIGSVRPGTNTYSVRVEGLAGQPVGAVRLDPASGVGWTASGPSKMRLRVGLPREGVHAGRRFTMKVLLDQASRRAPRQVSVTASGSDGVEVKAVSPTRLARLDGRASVNIEVEAQRTGTGFLHVAVASTAGSDVAVIRVPVGAEPSGEMWGWIRAAGGGLGAAAAVLLISRLRRRTRRTA